VKDVYDVLLGQLEIWPDLPRSKIGKVLKADIRKALLDNG